MTNSAHLFYFSIVKYIKLKGTFGGKILAVEIIIGGLSTIELVRLSSEGTYARKYDVPYY